LVEPASLEAPAVEGPETEPLLRFLAWLLSGPLCDERRYIYIPLDPPNFLDKPTLGPPSMRKRSNSEL